MVALDRKLRMEQERELLRAARLSVPPVTSKCPLTAKLGRIAMALEMKGYPSTANGRIALTTRAPFDAVTALLVVADLPLPESVRRIGKDNWRLSWESSSS